MMLNAVCQFLVMGSNSIYSVSDPRAEADWTHNGDHPADQHQPALQREARKFQSP